MSIRPPQPDLTASVGAHGPAILAGGLPAAGRGAARAAAPVLLTLGARRAERVLVCLLHLAAAAALAAWTLSWALPGTVPAGPWAGADPTALAGSAEAMLQGWHGGSALAIALVPPWLLAAGAWGWRCARRLLPVRPRRLAWTGRAWLLDDCALQSLQAVLDLGGWLLVRAQHPGGVDWLPVRLTGSAAAAAPAQAFRLALRWHAGVAAPQAEGMPR